MDAVGVGAVVNVEVVVAVQSELIETEHEPLENGVGLESNYAV